MSQLSLGSRGRAMFVMVVAIALLGSLAAAAPPAYRFTGTIWSPFGVAVTPSVPGQALVTRGVRGSLRVKEPGVAAVPWRPRAAAWVAGSAIAVLAQSRLWSAGRPATAPGPVPVGVTARSVEAGSLPVWVPPAASVPAPASTWWPR